MLLMHVPIMQGSNTRYNQLRRLLHTLRMSVQVSFEMHLLVLQ
jgi:hypothetical protein